MLLMSHYLQKNNLLTLLNRFSPIIKVLQHFKLIGCYFSWLNFEGILSLLFATFPTHSLKSLCRPSFPTLLICLLAFSPLPYLFKDQVMEIFTIQFHLWRNKLIGFTGNQLAFLMASSFPILASRLQMPEVWQITHPKSPRKISS